MSNVLKKFRKAAQKEAAQEASGVKTTKQIYFWSEFRTDENDNKYWMSADQLNQLHALNEAIDDDKVFYKEFAKLREREGIVADPKTTWYRKEQFGAEPSKKWTTWKDPTKGKSHLSEWWGGWKTQMGWGSGQDTKLALALRNAEVLLNVIDDSEDTPMTVRFSETTDVPVSYTDFRNKRLVVSPKPFLDGLPDGEAADIVSMFTMHEASHAKYTKALAKDLETNPIEPVAVASMVMNVMEDERIERLTMREYPGFAEYFPKGLDYMWKNGAKPPEAYGPDLTSKLNAMIGFVRWPQHFDDAKWNPEKAWWRAWFADYNEERVDHRTAIERALAHLRMPTPEEQSGGKSKPDPKSENGEQGEAGAELDKIAEDEEEMRKAGQAISDMIRKFLKEHGDKLKEFCTHRDHDGKNESLDSNTAEHVKQLVEEQIENQKPPITMDGLRAPKMIITKPKETNESKRYWKGDRDPLVTKYRNAIVLRPAKPLQNIKLQKSGRIDPENLWRWATDDWRVFAKKEIAERPAARIYLLIDMSGSMNGHKLESAQQIARLFLMALNSVDGVHTKVFGHTGDLDSSSSSEVYRLWEKGDPMSRLGLILSKQHGDNYDGYAISWVAEQLAKDSQPNEQKILIVLSDGYPAGEGYGGHEAQDHIRKVVDVNRRRDLRILQIAIDQVMREADQKRMFNEFIPFKPGDRLDEIPKRLSKFLIKVL